MSVRLFIFPELCNNICHTVKFASHGAQLSSVTHPFSLCVLFSCFSNSTSSRGRKMFHWRGRYKTFLCGILHGLVSHQLFHKIMWMGCHYQYSVLFHVWHSVSFNILCQTCWCRKNSFLKNSSFAFIRGPIFFLLNLFLLLLFNTSVKLSANSSPCDLCITSKHAAVLLHCF